MSKSLKSIIKTSKTKTSRIKNNNHSKLEKKEDTTESDSIEDHTITEIKLSEVVYPCIDDDNLQTKVLLYPYQMNNDLYINLKKNLKDKIEGKCAENCYIIKVYKIIDYPNGIIEPENFTGSAVYNVRYMAKKCVIVKGIHIIAKITSYQPNAKFAIAQFGPIANIVIQKNERDINAKNFSINNDRNLVHWKTNRKLAIDDFIKVQIRAVKFYKDDTVINCIGYLDNLATPDEIERYSYKPEQKSNDEINTIKVNPSISYNEDIEIEDKNIDAAKITQINKQDNYNEI